MEVKKILRIGGVLAALMPLATQVSAGDLTMDVQAIIASSMTESVTQNLDFGTIDLAPGASTIRIVATTGPATPSTTSGSSIVSGGSSGIIRVTGAIDMTIAVVYPSASFLINNGTDDITVSGIGAYSEGGSGTISHTANTTTDIDVGGQITLTGNESDGTYVGQMIITLNYS